MTDQDLELRLRSWYRAEIDDGASAPLQLRTENAGLAQAAARSRRWLPATWSFPSIHPVASFGLAAAAVVIALILGSNLLLPATPDIGASASPSATAPSPGPTVAGSATPEPSFSPPPGLEGRLLFSRRNEARQTWTGMFTILPDGSNELNVPLPSPEGGGRWSTSGREIAIPTTLPDGRIGTAILAADGTVLRVLEIPDPTLNVACTVWSPDDARLVCEGWDDADPSRRGIYAVSSVDGSDLLRLTAPPVGTADIPGDVSIEGQLVFGRGPDLASRGLWLVPLSGGAPVQLVGGAWDGPGRFNPDGSLVATSSRGQLYILDLDGVVVHQPNSQGRSDFGPDWSPDGAWIVFSSGITGPFADLFISRPDGSARFVVKTTGDNEIAVDWGRAP